MPYVDYLRPIIADADAGWVATTICVIIVNSIHSHGGLSAVMKLVKLFAESVRTIVFFDSF